MVLSPSELPHAMIVDLSMLYLSAKTLGQSRCAFDPLRAARQQRRARLRSTGKREKENSFSSTPEQHNPDGADAFQDQRRSGVPATRQPAGNAVDVSGNFPVSKERSVRMSRNGLSVSIRPRAEDDDNWWIQRVSDRVRTHSRFHEARNLRHQLDVVNRTARGVWRGRRARFSSHLK